jgi:hypothetical protein
LSKVHLGHRVLGSPSSGERFWGLLETSVDGAIDRGCRPAAIAALTTCINSGGVPQSLHFSRGVRELATSKSGGMGLAKVQMGHIQLVLGRGAGDEVCVLTGELETTEALGECPRDKDLVAWTRNSEIFADDFMKPA